MMDSTVYGPMMSGSLVTCSSACDGTPGNLNETPEVGLSDELLASNGIGISCEVRAAVAATSRKQVSHSSIWARIASASASSSAPITNVRMWSAWGQDIVAARQPTIAVAFNDRLEWRSQAHEPRL